MKKLSLFPVFLRPFMPVSLLTIGVLLATSPPVYAARLVTVLFTGFSASSGGQTGLDILNTTLQNTLGGNPNLPFSSKVFQHFEQQQAFDFIKSFNDVCCLTLIGHSLGGDSVIELAEDFLLPNNKKVDLTIQIDSVGIGDEKLPNNVKMGINYFQISTLLEPQGAQNVMGAMNINVEQLLNDNTITHTSIDDNPRLHKRIVGDIKAKCVPEPSSILGSLLALGTLGVGSSLKRKQKHKSNQ